MIKDQEKIRDIFNIFHDGDIANFTVSKDSIDLVIEIPYLAQRINKNFRNFYLKLNGCNDITLQTWPHKKEDISEIFKNPDQIFQSRLWILSAEIKGCKIEVACSQNDHTFDYCGGHLGFSVDSAIVLDENNREYSVEELSEICDAYWSDWETKSNV